MRQTRNAPPLTVRLTDLESEMLHCLVENNPQPNKSEYIRSLIYRQYELLSKAVQTGQTILDEGVHDGQNVQRSHILNDKDTIELHFS